MAKQHSFFVRPPQDWFPVITATTAISADVDLPENCNCLYNADSATRNIRVEMVGGETRTVPVGAGVIFPGQFTKVLQTGTDAATRNLWAGVL